MALKFQIADDPGGIGKALGDRADVSYDHAVLRDGSSQELARWKTVPGFELSFLPPYSPDLNPIERVWKLTPRLCLHNRYLPQMDDLTQDVEQQFDQRRRGNATLRRLCANI